jgi:hypothetical protein
MFTLRPILRAFFVLPLYTIFASFLAAQNPYISPTPGQDLMITSQAQLDGFVNGSGKYTSSDVGITLDGTSTTFTDLGNVSELTAIEGLLKIIGWGTDDAAGSSDPLAAFSSLTTVSELHVGRDLGNNEGIAAITSTTLSTIRNRLELIRCINAQTVSIPNVTATSGNIFIDSLTAVTTLDFSGLTSVGSNLQVEECRSLTTLDGFRFVETIGNVLSILRNDVLEGVSALGSAVPTGRPSYTLRRLVVRGNPLIPNLLTLTCTVGEDIVIVNNDQMTELGPIVPQQSMDRIEIGRHENLTGLSGLLDGTTPLNLKRFIFYRNAGFTATGSRPIRVETELTLDNLDISTPFDFSATTDVSARLNILNNANLSDLNSLGNIGTVGRMTVENNALLTTLDGFASLTNVTEAAFITGNPSLGDCCIFPEQVTVAGAPADSSNPNFTVSNNTGQCTDNATMDATCSAALPVSWRSLTAEWTGGAVKIEWDVLEETDNEKFYVERSTDGVQFTAIHSTPGKATFSARGSSYRYHDPAPPAGTIVYYRIRQVGFDGTSTLSKTVFLAPDPLPPSGFSIYPNPSRGRALRLQSYPSSDREDSEASTRRRCINSSIAILSE